MDLLKLNIFRGGIFKQIKFLFSSPKSAQKCVYYSESGVIAQYPLQITTGFVSSPNPDVKKAWEAVHDRKYHIYKRGQPYQDEQVLVISDRGYIPLDPFKKEKKENRTSLTDIAKMRHASARADVNKQRDTNIDIAQTIILGSFVLGGLMALLKFFAH